MAGSRITLELGIALVRLCTYCNTEVKVNDFLGCSYTAAHGMKHCKNTYAVVLLPFI